MNSRVAPVLLFLLVACKGASHRPSPSRPPPEVVAVKDAAPLASPAAVATAAPDAGRPKIDVDLLHWSPAGVAVPSNVDNPRDYPEHLVDGRPETAWNGKTGDFEGRIAFQVPALAHVRQIELSAGFDKKGPKGDLFTMNHRIRSVKVTLQDPKTRQETTIGIFTLDINQRLPQPIPIDRPGGTYFIDILATEPGTNKAWQELVVSELHVMGDPGPTKLSTARMPNVVVGSPDQIRSDTPPVDPSALEAAYPFAAPTAAAVCAKYEKLAAASFANIAVDRYPGPPQAPYCKLGGPLFAGFQPTGAVKGVRNVTVASEYGTERRFVIEKADGAVMPLTANLGTDGFDGDATTTSATIKGLRVDGGDLVVTYVETIRHARYCMDSQTVDFTRTIELDLRCSIDAKPIECTRVERRTSCVGFSCESFGW